MAFDPLTAGIAIFGFWYVSFLSEQRENKNRQFKFLERQLDEFYAPLEYRIIGLRALIKARKRFLLELDSKQAGILFEDIQAQFIDLRKFLQEKWSLAPIATQIVFHGDPSFMEIPKIFAESDIVTVERCLENLYSHTFDESRELERKLRRPSHKQLQNFGKNLITAIEDAIALPRPSKKDHPRNADLSDGEA